MFHILGILFIIIIAILIIGLSIIGTVVRSVFGLKGRGSTSGGYSFNGDKQKPNSSQKQETTEAEEESHLKRKKLFAKDEGEYVDFEEVRE